MEDLKITKIADLVPGTNYNIIAKIVKPISCAFKKSKEGSDDINICDFLIADDTACIRTRLINE